MAIAPIQGDCWEDGGSTNLSRVYGAAGAAITQASLSTITYAVFDLQSATPDTSVDDGSVTISTSVFDTLQTDGIWTKDDTGYNFKHTIAATVPSTANHVYRTEYLFTPVSGQPFWVVFEALTKKVRTS